MLGGTGNFGARICLALSADPRDAEVIATGRAADQGSPQRGIGRASYARLDMHALDFSESLRRLRPNIVIHCAGPFQGQDYRVARAAIEAGAHYIDLSDGRDFVASFAAHLDGLAQSANLLAVSGASTLPALSSAVIDHLLPGFRQLETIHLAIAPGQRAPRGVATMAGVLSYAGQPFKWLQDSQWVDVWGWQALREIHFPGLGPRWAAACDVPDLALLPKRHPAVKSVAFRAALELRIQHLALWLFAALRRSGVRVPIEYWAGPLNRMAAMMDGFGSDRGGMLVELGGIGFDGQRKRIDWHLIAGNNHGPEIPCIAAILLARKLARKEIDERGARPCMGLLTLAEFEPEFRRWGITTKIEEIAV